MKRKLSFVFMLALFLISGTMLNAQTLVNEHFDYPVGDSITAHGWIGHSGFGTNTLTVSTGNLSYTGYPVASGNSVYMKNSGHDAHKDFTFQTSGSIYAAAIIKVDSSKTTGDYFMHFMKPNNTTILVGRIFIKRDATLTNKFAFGISKNSAIASAALTSYNYNVNTEYLVVLKYNLKPGTANDSVSLFINPAISTEGAPTLVATDMSASEIDTIASISIRQGGSANAAYLRIDEIRVATNWNDVIGYGAVVAMPTISTGSNSGITQTTATLEGNVTADGGAVVTARGFCWGTTANPALTDSVTTVTGTTGAFSAILNNLTAGTTYHYRAYATNSAGTSYGGDSVFTTANANVAPVVTTGTVSNITTTTVTVGGEVTNDGGATVTARGICWSTSANPSITDSHSSETGTIGTFTSDLSGLTPATMYHVRAYATNSVGTSYGDDVVFTTAIQIPTYAIAQVKGVNANGVADSLNVKCKLEGIVHGINFTATGYSFYIIDGNAGINVYKQGAAFSYQVTEGDRIRAIGKIAQYSGLTEIAVDSITFISAGNQLNTPVVVTALTEANESQLVRMDNLVLVNPATWPVTASSSALNVKALYGTDTIIIRIHNLTTLNGSPAPNQAFSIVGLCTQFDSSNPYTSGYQIMPRYLADRIGGIGIDEDALTSVKIYPNPATDFVTVENAMNSTIKVFSIVGELIWSGKANNAKASISTQNWTKGIYFIQLINGETITKTTKFVVK